MKKLLFYFVVYMGFTGALLAANKREPEGNQEERSHKRAKYGVFSSSSRPLKELSQVYTQNLLLDSEPTVPAAPNFSAFSAEIINNPESRRLFSILKNSIRDYIQNLDESGILVIILNFCTSLNNLDLLNNDWQILRLVSKKFCFVVDNAPTNLSVSFSDRAYKHNMCTLPWRFIKKLQNLRVLELDSVQFDDKFADSLTALLSNHHQIYSLTLRGCTGFCFGNLSDGHLDKIAAGLAEVLIIEQSVLSHIEIISNAAYLGDYYRYGQKSCFTYQGIEKIAMALEKNTVLRSFAISLIALNDVPQCTIRLAECLRKNTSLQNLVIGDNLVLKYDYQGDKPCSEDERFLGYYLKKDFDFKDTAFDKKDEFVNAIKYLISRIDLEVGERPKLCSG